MKLLYITNGITGAGGLERVLSVKASALAEDFGYEIHILSLNEEGKATFYEFSPKIVRHSIDVGGNPFSYLKDYISGIRKVVKQINPEIISVCDDGFKGFFLPLLIRTKSKWIYERHVSKLIETRSGRGIVHNIVTQTKWALMDRLAKNFSRFVVLTDGNKKEWPLLPNLEVIPNPLSFYPSESSPLDQKKVICVGKMSFQKGQDLLVQAWDKVWQKHPDWTLELYGNSKEGFLNTEKLKEKNIVHFPADKNIMDRYLDSSIYVMSSRYEGFGMVLIEAMACGVPCISFDCNYGPADIIKNNEDGFLVKNQDTKDLSNKIIQLIENKNLRYKLGKNAKINVQRFDKNAIAQIWDNLFKVIQKEI